jgi:hypothetical protein
VVRGGACTEDERVSTLGHGGGRVPTSGAQTGSPLGWWRHRCGHGWVGGSDVGTVRQCAGECRSGGMISQGGGGGACTHSKGLSHVSFVGLIRSTKDNLTSFG